MLPWGNLMLLSTDVEKSEQGITGPHDNAATQSTQPPAAKALMEAVESPVARSVF
jgi:hypothetical protein